MEVRGGRGHRLAEHTADVFVEAWAPDLAGCCEEAAAGLVAVYADGPVEADRAPAFATVVAVPAEEAVVTVLEEIVFLLDTSDAIPVGAKVRPGRGGVTLDVEVAMASPSRVRGTGSVPKAVARSELSVVEDDMGVRCRVLVDV